MYVLGLGGLGYKDSSAAILADGRPLAAVSEDRFTGVKHEGGYPRQAVRFCLERAGISMREVHTVAVANNPWLPMREKVLQWYGEGFLASGTANVYSVFKDDTHRLIEYLQALEAIRGLGVEIQEVSHDRSHAGLSFFGSPFENAAVLSLDGRGEVSTSSIGRGRGLEMTVDSVSRMPDSLGLLYALVADYLGYSELDDEFRLISLSPSGTPTFVPRMRNIVALTGDHTVKLNEDYFGHHQGRVYLSERFKSEFGPPHDPDLPLEDRHRDLAASLHQVVMSVVARMTEIAREKSGSTNLCLGGGLVQNWGLVGAIDRTGLFDAVYVPPAPGDDGTALGAALFHYHAELGRPRTGPILRSDFGPSFPEDEIAWELDRLKLKPRKPADLPTAAAERISGGEIVGWFQGAAEYGSRALGHRSILADPTDPATRPRLVASVKARSEFHPFGLSVTEEAATELFEGLRLSPFLERTGQLKPDAQQRLPAVAAVQDGTRVQTVNKEREPLFHSLLTAVGRRTGVQAVLNTSLNEPGRPMATTPREAIGSLYTTGLDALAIGPFLLSK
ncbi:MAG: carbamoyltransferase family protein [Planctomycetota bacterium]|jgi:carbamoyltransferase